MLIKAEVDHCRPRLMKYCQGQGLDIGCGQYKIRPDAIGIDLNGQGDMVMDARCLKYYPDNFFDYVFSCHLLEELANTEATLREWLRVIKEGGYVVLYQVDQEYYHPIGHPACNPRHHHHFSWESLWAIFEKIGGVDLIHHQRYAPEPYDEWSFELVVRKRGSKEFTENISDTSGTSLLVPTLNRAKSIKAFSDAVVATTTRKDLVEVVFGIHADDKVSLEAVAALSELPVTVRSVIIDQYKDRQPHLSFCWNQMYRATSNPIIGFFGDDVLFRTPGWDEEVRKEFMKDRGVMVSCNDVHIHRGTKATLFFTHRAVHDKVGYYLSEKFRRWYMDNFLGDAYKMAGKLRYREDLITEHMSPDVFKERIDRTYSDMGKFTEQDKMNWSQVETREEIARIAHIIRETG